MIQSNTKIQAGWAHGGFYQIFIFRVFFSFNAAASVDYVYLQAGRVRPGGGGGMGVKANLIFFVMGGCGGVQNKLEQKSRGSRQIFFSIISIGIFFFSNGRVRQEGG